MKGFECQGKEFTNNSGRNEELLKPVKQKSDKIISILQASNLVTLGRIDWLRKRRNLERAV